MPGLFASLVLAVPSIWIVDAAGGAGAHFVDLPTAVAAAAHGDTLLIRAGTYAPFSTTGKALLLRRDGPGPVLVTPTFAAPAGAFIGAPPAGSTFVVSGIRFAPSGLWSTSTTALTVSGPGFFLLHETECSGAQDASAGGVGLHVTNGATLRLSKCAVFGGPASHPFFLGAPVGGDALRAESGARVAADATSFLGGFASGGAAFGGAGARIVDAEATLARCTTAGGGVSEFGPYLSAAGDGVVASGAASVRVSGGAAHSAAGGLGGGGAASGFAASATGGAVVTVHDGVTLASAHPSGPTSGSTILGAPRLPTVATGGPPALSGGLSASDVVSVVFESGLPFAPYLFLVDVSAGYSTAYAAFALGEVLVPVPPAVVIEGALGADG
ncbi:MAG TPA: hypothetical protein VEI02_02950, partial [Planctomycetota bacterium]|nr:hypothetical protein [Planctomycetota bacterium]